MDQGKKLLYCVEKHGVTIVVELPQYLYEAGWAASGNVIACTQPRRVAATSVATRVAAEVGTILGEEVGYTIRFEDVSHKERTRIKYMTDGMLFRETMLDPLLSKYSVIMIDEAHERSIYTDLMLGILKKIRRKRPSLRLIISSATLDASFFLDYFNLGNSPNESIIVSLEGRMFPVEVAYLREPTSDYVREAVKVVWGIHLQQGRGDILVFLTGREEIDRLPRTAGALSLLPLYAGLPNEDQMRVFEPAERGTRKVILSTNIAEASVTIENIRFVVDCGFVKVFPSLFPVCYPVHALSAQVDPYIQPDVHSFLSHRGPTSYASATQRAGRAGRTAPGFCYRLYPESVLPTLPRTSAPEIVRTDLTTPILQLKSLGIDDLIKFEWVTNPPAESVLRALEALVNSGMVDSEGRLTELFNSKEYKCGAEILTIAAMTSVQDVFVIPDGAAGALAELERRKFTAEEGDHLTLLNDSRAYGRMVSFACSVIPSYVAAVSIRAQLKKYMVRFGLPLDSCEGDQKRLRKCLVGGYWRNGRDGWPMERSELCEAILSVMFTRKPRTGWVVFHEMEETKKIHIRIITEIEPDWLLEYGHKLVEKRS
ncbi:hypothetical protein BS47DRAFT_1363993 [Hydnum rufescens UP504]|uniref:RNA helicase n=1 Tax=Hydnum rufescens UP504 TaxID=1448309 RepID=A0A9P6ASY6_9AGAM|nr:hypothetical protein BS47DRAFT_1363993 [Hydnum rufescens UP504]